MLPIVFAVASFATVPAVREERIQLPGFGTVEAYRPEPVEGARGVVLFVSGDGGWNLGVVDMARRIAPRAIVAGISMPAWQKRVEAAAGRCWYPAGELETAAQALEKRYRLPRYFPPILVGYSSGATVIYGALAQSPPGTFAGGVSLGFCPDLEVAKPVCGRGGWKPSYDEKKRRSWLTENIDVTRWTALQGTKDEVCDPEGTAKYVARIPGSRVVMLPKVGHGFSVPKNWGEAFDRSLDELLEPTGLFAKRSEAKPGRGLDSLELPLELAWPERPRAILVFVSGDGGWAELDRSVAAALDAKGIAVVGLNTLRYFWSARSPEELRDDLARLVAALPEDLPVFLGGYSFGAEAVPVAFATGPRPAALSRVAGLVLIEPSPWATFEVSPLDWFRTSEEPTGHSVASAIERASVRVLCIDGAEEAESGCRGAPPASVEHVELPGGHHLGGAFETIAAKIEAFVRADVARGPAASPSGSAGSRAAAASGGSGAGRPSPGGGGSRARP